MTFTHNHFLGGHGVTIGSATVGGVWAIRVKRSEERQTTATSPASSCALCKRRAGRDVLMVGIAPQLPMEGSFDGVSIASIAGLRQQIAHVKVTMGPGPVNWTPQGEHVQIIGKAGNGKLQGCKTSWVKWPAESGIAK